VRRCAVLANAGYSVTALEIGDLQSAGRTVGIEILPFEIRRSEDIGPAFETLKGRAEALYIVGDPLLNANQMLINVLALTSREALAKAFRRYFFQREHPRSLG
jgi:ABC-type uncharacterized transport system substrate-binding protein